MRIAVVEDPILPRECKPAKQIGQLLETKRLPNMIEAASIIGKDGLGNCHHVVIGLMTDLVVANQAKGWQWATGLVKDNDPNSEPPFHSHSWLEVDGWSVDMLKTDFIIFSEVSYYRRVKGANNIQLRDATATKEWLLNDAPRIYGDQP